jgi:hypothetical protein
LHWARCLSESRHRSADRKHRNNHCTPRHDVIPPTSNKYTSRSAPQGGDLTTLS